MHQDKGQTNKQQIMSSSVGRVQPVVILQPKWEVFHQCLDTVNNLTSAPGGYAERGTKLVRGVLLIFLEWQWKCKAKWTRTASNLKCAIPPGTQTLRASSERLLTTSTSPATFLWLGTGSGSTGSNPTLAPHLRTLLWARRWPSQNRT